LNTRFQLTVTKSEPRLMSTAPSLPPVKLLWSIQMLVADVCTLMASSFHPRNVMLRMMTLRSPLMFSPHPAMVAPALPMIVLWDRTRSMPEQEMVPDTRITAALLEPSAVVSADAEVTVVVAALPPPVVPPFWVAQPTRSSTPNVRGGAAGTGAAVAFGASATAPPASRTGSARPAPIFTVRGIPGIPVLLFR
jgi:hypothetical protein